MKRAPPGADALLDPHRIPGWRARSRDPAVGVLAADAEFRRTHDPLVALAGAQLALEHDLVVPPSIARWLLYGLSRPPSKLNGPRMSIDAALGLNKPGKASPFRRQQEEHALRAALGRMFHLQTLDADIPQAAALVAQVVDFTFDTLVDRYRRGGYTAELNKLKPLQPTDPEPALAEYPDGPLEVMQAKAAIRAMYAKRRS